MLHTVFDPATVAELRRAAKLDDAGEAQRGLLMVVLSAIFITGGEMNDAELWRVLERVDVKRCAAAASRCARPRRAHRPRAARPSRTKANSHDVLGDSEALLKGWKSEQYLQELTDKTADPAVVSYRWGPKAKAEIDRETILTFILDMEGRMQELPAVMKTFKGKNEEEDGSASEGE